MQDTEKIKNRLSRLREQMKKYKLEGYIIPTADEYLGEFTSEYATRLRYISGFTGSFGIAIILQDKSILFTDSRYFLQARNELPEEFEILDIGKLGTNSWYELLGDNPRRPAIGYDPMLFSRKVLEKFNRAKVELISLYENLVDNIWQDQPKKPLSEIVIYPLKYCGEPFSDKLSKIRSEINSKHASSIVITESGLISWILNLRARDLEVAPVLQGYMIITLDKAILYTRCERISLEIRDYLAPEVEVREEDKFIRQIREIPGPVLVCVSKTPAAVLQVLETAGTEIIDTGFPSYPHELKARKNPTELESMINGHIYDSIALCEFLAFMDTIIERGEIYYYTEYNIAKFLDLYREKNPYYIGRSFPTISGFNARGAIIHYHPTEENAARIDDNGLLLIDSGGQYNIGCTTDVTRIVAIGEPGAEHIDNYTSVLKGHIDLANTGFPEGTSGLQLDTIARRPLWANGLNYGHGTGHGVGAYLHVHEAPPVISPNSDPNMNIKSGMICSNEPGYYKEGEYGIRIENLLYVTASESSGFLNFNNLTLVPYEKDLIDKSRLNEEQINYLQNYYQKISEEILPHLSEEGASWLRKQLSAFLD